MPKYYYHTYIEKTIYISTIYSIIKNNKKGINQPIHIPCKHVPAQLAGKQFAVSLHLFIKHISDG